MGNVLAARLARRAAAAACASPRGTAATSALSSRLHFAATGRPGRWAGTGRGSERTPDRGCQRWRDWGRWVRGCLLQPGHVRGVPPEVQG